jgi:hypothetical protein
MKSFKHFFTESPQFVNFKNTNLTKFNSDYVNKNYAIYLKNNFTPLDKVNGNDGKIYTRFSIGNETNKTDIYLLDDEVYMFFNYKVENNSIKEHLIWTSKKVKGLYRYLIFNFYLPNYSYFESDSQLTEFGYPMWKKIILQALSLRKKATVVNLNDTQEIQFTNDTLNSILENIFLNDSKDERIRIYN